MALPSSYHADGSLGFFDGWTSTIDATATPLRRGLAFIAALAAWSIWRHHKPIISEKITPSSFTLIDAIKEEACS